jgi:sorting nexin-13
VFGVARQVLSLVAGGAIDEWLLSNLRFLRQEHTLARIIHHLQAQLWPGGTWYQSLPEHQPPVRHLCSERPCIWDRRSTT